MKPSACLSTALVCALFSATPPAAAAPGALDTTFGTGGHVFSNFGHGFDNARAVAVDSAGRVLVAGSARTESSRTILCLARFAGATYQLDTTFGVGGVVALDPTPLVPTSTDTRAAALTVATQMIAGEERILVAGSCGDPNPDDSLLNQQELAVARYHADGSLDTTFGAEKGFVVPYLTTGSDSATRVIPLADGKSLLGVSSYASFILVRLNVDGSFDGTFGSGGKVTTSGSGDLCDIAVDGSGRILAAATSSISNTKITVLRYDSNGFPDTSFGSQGKVEVPVNPIGTVTKGPARIVAQSDGKFFIGTSAKNPNNSNGGFDLLLMHFNADGSLDASFDGDSGMGDGMVYTTISTTSSEVLTGLMLDHLGRILVAGTSSTSSTAIAVTARYEADTGKLDTTFGGGDGILPTILSLSSSDPGTTPSIAENATSGKIHLAATTTGGDFTLTTCDAAGSTASLVTTTADLGLGADRANALARSGNYIYVAGASYNGIDDDFTLARYDATTGALDVTFGSGGVAHAGFSVGSYDEANALAVQPDGRIVLAGVTAASGSANMNFALACFTTMGALDMTFGTGGKVTTDNATNYDIARGIALDSQSRIFAAGGAESFQLVCYKPDGTLDTGFGSSGRVISDFGSNSESARMVAVQNVGGTEKVLVGGYSGNKVALARFAATTGAPDTSFGTGGVATSDPFGYIAALTLQPDGAILVAGEAYINNGYVLAGGRCTAAGVLDGTFGTGGRTLLSPLVSSLKASCGLALQADGSVVMAGATPSADGDDDIALVRLTGKGAVDAGFGSSGVLDDASGGHEQATSLTVQTDTSGGEWLLLAGYGQRHGNTDFLLARYNGSASPVIITPTPTTPGSTTPTPTTPGGSAAQPTVAITGKKKITTTKASVKVKGTASGTVTAVLVKNGKKTVKAAGTASWSAKVKLTPGTNKITAVATGPGGASAPAKVTVIRK